MAEEWTGLTDAGNEVVEALLGEERVLQASEVELQHAGHRVDVSVALLVNQRVVTCRWGGGGVNDEQAARGASGKGVRGGLTSLKGVLDVVDLHL